MADSTLSNLTSLTLPSQATDLLLVGRGTARPNKVAMSDALNSAALAATTSTYGVAQLATDGGTTAGTVVQATDARLSDTRNPPDGSKGDIVVSGSGSTWTIKTNPTLSGNVTATGWIKTADGTAAAPAYAFTSESGLGFYRAAATGVGFATGGANSLTFYPNGEMYGAQGNNRLALYPTGSIGLIASSSNQTITLTPSGAATAGSLVVSRLTSTSQTLALLNYGTDELMSIVGTGYTGVGSRSNTGFLLYSNNTERARFLAGGNFLIAKTIDNTLGRLQVSGAITMEEAAGTGLFGFFGGSSLVYGSLASNPVVIRTNNTAALTLDTSQNATFAGNVFASGTRGFSRYKSANGTIASPVEDRIVGFSNTNNLLFDVGMFAANSLTDNSSVWLRFKALDSIGNPQIGLTVTSDTVTLSPTGSGQAIIANNSGAGTATRLSIAQTGVRIWYIENTATTGNLTFGDGAGEVLRVIGSGAGTFLFGTTTNSNNGRIQLATHTADTGGLGFGSDCAIYRYTAESLAFKTFATTGPSVFGFYRTTNRYFEILGNGVDCYLTGQGSMILRSNNGTTALTLDTSQNGILAGSYFFLGGAGSNFYIRSTGSDNGLIRGNTLSVDFASDFLFRNNAGTTEYARVVGSSGTFLLGTTTNSSNGRLQLADHTAATGGIGMGTDWSFFRLNTSILRFQTASVSPGLSLRHSTSGTELTLTASTASGNGIVNTVSCNNLVLGVNGGTALTLDNAQNATFAGNINALAGKSLNFTGTATALSSFVNMYVTSLAGGDATGGRMTWYSSGTGNVETGWLQVTQPDGFGGTFSIGLNTTNSGTASTVFQIKKNGNTLLGTTTDSSNGRLQLATHTASTGGIGFGTDVTLYRFAANILKTDDSFQALNNADTYLQVGAAAPYQRAAIGLTRRLNYGDVLFARNLQGQSGTDSYTAIGTDTGSGYAGFEAQYGGVARILLGTGATTADAVVTPTVALSASTSAVSIPLSTVSNSTSSGALVVSGGLGVGGVINAGPGTHIFGNAASTGQLRVQRITTNPSSVTLNAVASFPNIDLGSEGGGYTFGSIQSNSTEILRVHNANLAQITNVSGGGLAIGGGLRVSSQTVSTSTITGAAVISGGVGIAGDTYIGGNLVVTGTISPSSGAGLTNVWIPASQWIPRTTNGCGVDSTETTTNRQNFDELLFDPAAIEYAQALVRMPSNYNNGTVTARFFWSSSSSTGSVVWGLQARAFADDDALDTAFGTAQTVTDTLLATGDMHVSAATSAITSGGTPAATTPLQFQIYRDATNASDTLGSDARLLGVEISFTSV